MPNASLFLSVYKPQSRHRGNARETHIGISHTEVCHIDGVTRSEVGGGFFFASIVLTMAETTELIKLLADHIQVQKQQMEQQSQHHREAMEQQAQHHKEEMQNLLKLLDVQNHGTGEDDSSTHHPQLSTAAIPPFAVFDSTSELWPDYGSRFCTFVVANAVPGRHKFSSRVKLLLYTNNWLTWLFNKLRPRTSTS